MRFFHYTARTRIHLESAGMSRGSVTALDLGVASSSRASLMIRCTTLAGIVDWGNLHHSQ